MPLRFSRLSGLATLALGLAGAAQAQAQDRAQDRVADLPLIEAPTRVAGDAFAVLYSGDGGWTAVDKGIAASLGAAGVPTVGVNALRYFWSARSPAEAAADLTAVIDRYGPRWSRREVVLIGYSFGADALPIIVASLAPEVRARVRLLALVAVDHEGQLQFHLTDWINRSRPGGYAIAPVLARLEGLRMICIYGDEEADDACPTFPSALIRPVRLSGGHHFDGDYAAVGRAILQATNP